MKLSTRIHFLNFNQDKTYFCVGTDDGYEIYNCDPFKLLLKKAVPPNGVCCLSMLYKTNVIAYVKKDNTFEKNEEKNVVVYNEEDNNIISVLQFKDVVRNILMNRKIILISISSCIYLYSLPILKSLYKIELNPVCQGICSMTNILDNQFQIACVGEKIKLTGTLDIWNFQISEDGEGIEVPHKNTLQAHDSLIRYVTFSDDGKYIATCSEKGTLVRIFDIASSKMLKELRRGTDQTTINWISFSPDNKYILCRSKKGTVHVFYTDYNENRQNNNKTTYISNLLGRYFGGAKKYLPQYMNSEWGYHSIHFPGVTTISAFSHKPDTIIVISFKGIVYEIDYSNADHVAVRKHAI